MRCDLGMTTTQRIQQNSIHFQRMKSKKKHHGEFNNITPSPTLSASNSMNVTYEIPIIVHVIMTDDGSQGFVPLDSI